MYTVQYCLVYSHCCMMDFFNIFILWIWNSIPIKHWLFIPASNPWKPPFEFSFMILITYILYTYLSFSDWLISFNIMYVKSIHVVAFHRIVFVLFCFWWQDLAIYPRLTLNSWSSYLSLPGTGITWNFNYQLDTLLQILLNMYLETELLDHVVIPF
jgi:hypothetical protein